MPPDEPKKRKDGDSTSSRLDRIEAALEMFIADHEQFREEHKRLLAAQVVGFDESNKRMARIEQNLAEATDKLNGVIGVVDAMGRRFDEVGLRFDEVGRRFDEVGRKFDEMGRRFDEMREHFDGRLRLLGGD